MSKTKSKRVIKHNEMQREIADLKVEIARLQGDVVATDLLERQIRDLSAENGRLRAEVNELRAYQASYFRVVA